MVSTLHAIKCGLHGTVTSVMDTFPKFKVHIQSKYHQNAYWCRPYERRYKTELFPSRKERPLLSLFVTERTIRIMLTCGLVAPTHKDERVPNLRQEQLGHDIQKKIMITLSYNKGCVLMWDSATITMNDYTNHTILEMSAWEHIFTALEFAPTPTACCAASTKPWTETILDDVPHYPVGQSVSDTGRPGQKWRKTNFSLLYYYFCHYCLSLGLLCLFWMF